MIGIPKRIAPNLLRTFFSDISNVIYNTLCPKLAALTAKFCIHKLLPLLVSLIKQFKVPLSQPPPNIVLIVLKPELIFNTELSWECASTSSKSEPKSSSLIKLAFIESSTINLILLAISVVSSISVRASKFLVCSMISVVPSLILLERIHEFILGRIKFFSS